MFWRRYSCIVFGFLFIHSYTCKHTAKQQQSSKSSVKSTLKQSSSSSHSSSNHDRNDRRKSFHLKSKKIRDAYVKYSKKKPIVPMPKESILAKACKKMSEISTTIAQTKRELKGYFSSDFEALILKLTSPDEKRIDADGLNTIIATIESFTRNNIDISNAHNPYRVTIHKVWSKCIEHSIYTKIKGLLILHTILRYTEPEDGVIFKTVIHKMSKEYMKSSIPRRHYFDISHCNEYDTNLNILADILVDSTPDLEELKLFVRGYSSYVCKRSRAFTSLFEEMKSINSDMQTQDICAQLLKANKLINAALSCRPSRTLKCESVTFCMELLARDLKDVFLLYFEKLTWLLSEEEEGRSKHLFAGWKIEEVDAVLAHFKAFYDERIEDVQAFLDEAHTLLNDYGLSFPSSLHLPKSLHNQHNYTPREMFSSTHTIITEADDDMRDITESDADLHFDDREDEPSVYEASDEYSSSSGDDL